VVLLGIFVSLVPPGDALDKLRFQVSVFSSVALSVLIGLALYWRGARSKKETPTQSV